MIGWGNKGGIFVLALLMLAPLMLAMPSAYAQAHKELYVPATARWQHASTGMVAHPEAAGMKRGKITVTAPMELDVQVQYEAADRATFATIFIFRPAVGDLALWFDRATTTIAASDRWSIASTLESGPVLAPGGEQANAFQAIYALDGARFSSTGIKMVAMGDWVAKIRMTSANLDTGQLKALLDTFVSQITWPSAAAKAPPVTPMAACASALVFGKSARPKRRSKDDAFANALVAAVMSGSDATADENPASTERTAYCRDSIFGTHGVYRRVDGTADSYLLALNDAGRAASVYPAMGLFDAESARKGYSVSLLHLDRTYNFVDYNAMVPPAQLLDIVNNQKAISSVSTADNGSTITLDNALIKP